MSASNQSLHESAHETLPPSPEFKPSIGGSETLVDSSSFSLDASPSTALASNVPIVSNSRRLRSVARYQAFHPQALACSDTLTISTDNILNDEEINGVSSTSMSSIATKRNTARGASLSNTTTSLGALAGPQGVALFRMSRPHIPLLILSHATNSKSKLSNISGLAFQPNADAMGSQSLYLAATRGTASLIWDASGHSTMPLIGRLGSDMNVADAFDTRITSMCWKPSSRTASATAPLLATTTANSISLWDLRVAPQGSTSFKPTLRIGTAKQTSFSNSSAIAPKLVQVACSSESDELATIDSAGIVRIYDIRMAERNRAPSTSGSAASSFRAHETAGVGLAYFPTKSANNNAKTLSSSWLTWGLDSPKASAVAKLWSWTGNEKQQAAADPDDYWYMYATPFNRSDYRLNAQLVRPNLACARICPLPLENAFMAVGHHPYRNSESENSTTARDGWWAELCTLAGGDGQNAVDGQVPSSTFGLKSVVSFEGGGTISYDWGQKALLSALGGRSDLGRLQAAELAFSGVSSQSHLLTPAVERALDTVEEDEGTNIELVLCCLSDTSVITTHAIPEALPRVNSIRSGESGRSELSPSRARMVCTAFNTGFQPRVYREDRKEGASLMDAAGFWNSNVLGAGEVASSAVDELGRTFSDTKMSPQKNSLLQTDTDPADPKAVSSGRSKSEGGLIPFDVEVPVAYGSVSSNHQVAMTDINSGTVTSAGGMGVVEEDEPVTSGVRKATSILENIESERVPCPPLCGATFGFGNGGLVMFHNGEIKKMWHWFQRTDTIRLASAPSRKADSSAPDEVLSPRIDASITDKPTITSGPRTLKELVNMMKTAKEAQWGERDGSDGFGSDDNMSAGDNFFEDESLDSNSSESGDEGALAHTSNDHIYNRYFGSKAWKGSVEKGDDGGSHRRQNSESTATTPTRKSGFVGPSYDMLAPVVSVTHDFDSEIVSHQSIELARGWELGGWENSTFSDSLLSAMKNEENPDTAIFDYHSSALPRQGLPSYKYLDPTTPAKNGTMPRTQSDPNLGFKMIAQRLRPSMDEPGVHGGEYSVRPHMEDSMKFLKKLFTHQQQDASGAFPNMLSPPDNPLQWDRQLSSTGNIQSLGEQRAAGHFFGTGTEANPERRGYTNRELGVYTVRKESMKGEHGKEVAILNSIKDICLHNAGVCKSVGETDKEGVWNLLAQTVDGQIGNKESGWGGKGGGALGVELVSGLLQYYERLGDAQMLATMFCVLSGGFRSTLQPGSPQLLPQGQDEKYDSYIRKYAELLYAWELLSIRAELNKHLLRVPSLGEGHFAAEESKHQLRLSSRIFGVDLSVTPESTKAKGLSAPGFAVIFHCPRCGRDADKNTNVCRSCQDFVFRCSICDNAVRGLFTVCSLCNHGGHTEHIKLWFSDHAQCPTGCGCNCTLVFPLPTNQSDAMQGIGQPLMAVDT